MVKAFLNQHYLLWQRGQCKTLDRGGGVCGAMPEGVLQVHSDVMSWTIRCPRHVELVVCVGGPP